MRKGLLLLSGAALIISISIAWAGANPATADPPHNIPEMAIDMDPTGNTATSVGTVEPCARIDEDDGMAGDEDEVDTVYFDVVVPGTGVPAAHPLTGIGFEVNFSSANLQVIEPTPSNLGDSTHGHHRFLLFSLFDVEAYNGGDVITTGHDNRPDIDGQYIEATLDFSDNTGETGDGVLIRLGFQSTEAAVNFLSATKASQRALAWAS